MKGSNDKVLNRFTACFAFVFDKDFNSLRGFSDGDDKFYCTYLARQILGLDSRLISAYYRINRTYMEKNWESVEITSVVYESLSKRFEVVKGMWNAVKVENEV